MNVDPIDVQKDADDEVVRAISQQRDEQFDGPDTLMKRLAR